MATDPLKTFHMGQRHCLTFGQKCPILEMLKASEFVRKVRGLAKEKGIAAEYIPERGKGSHGTLYFGKKRTTVPHLKNELKSGTFHAMLRQLGIKVSELR